MIELKGELDKFLIIGGNFNTSLSTVVRKTGQKNQKGYGRTEGFSHV